MAEATRVITVYFVTPRQLQVVELMAQGMTDVMIGCALGIARRTVVHHICNALRRTGYKSREQLVAQLTKQEIIEVRPIEPRPDDVM